MGWTNQQALRDAVCVQIQPERWANNFLLQNRDREKTQIMSTEQNHLEMC
jgi:hypothetical protein